MTALLDALGPLVADPFPNGVAHYLLGGTLVGLGVATFYLGTGVAAGASTVLESTLSYVSGLSRFRRYLASRDWRVAFAVGIVLGGAVYAVLVQGGAWTTEVQWWRLLLGGVLVGVGTRVGKGCTSGHGICGVASVSRASLVNVALFLSIAVGTAQAVAALGVAP
jgi:uncharacterized membrane protein YedE/YeeE